jgi:predicted nucleotidyltransferase
VLKNLFGSKVRARALAWLVMHPDERYFVRQLTGIIGEDSTNLSRELAKLADIGLLTCRQEGRQKYYQVNRGSPVFEELRGLAVKTSGLADVLREALGPLGDRIRIAFLFGSFAEGRESARSDVDVAIIGSVSLAEVSKALGPAEKTLGREINPVVYPEDEFRKKVLAGHHFVTSIIKGKKIFLVGESEDLRRVAGKRTARST